MLNKAQKISQWVVVLLIMLLTACAEPAEKNLVMHEASGASISLPELRGKWIIINYWAAWCHSCIKEIPELNRFYQQNKQNVILFGVNYDHLSQPELNQAIEAAHVSYPVLVDDPSLIFGLEDVTVLPTTFIINPQGQIVKKIVGVNTAHSLQQALIAAGENFDSKS